ncbi:MAG: hypothetical protein H5U40_17815, partial [Polyangiaceae bacterium]|nr:hypothetical protein [Polyangiaceae bacterium]
AAPSHADAALALADALRLAGDLTAAEAHFERARESATVSRAELHRVAALLLAAKANGDLARAKDEAFLAVEAEPDLVRNRVLLARALIAGGDVPAARRQLVEAGAEHEMVQPLLTMIDAATRAPIAPEEVPTGSVAPAAEPPPSAAPAERSGLTSRSSRRSTVTSAPARIPVASTPEASMQATAPAPAEALPAEPEPPRVEPAPAAAPAPSETAP